MFRLIVYILLLSNTALAQKEIWFTEMGEALKNPDQVTHLRLKKKGLLSFPEELCLFSNLVELDLSKNKIKSFPTFMNCFEGLEVLKLSRNEIVEIPREVALLQNLRFLDLWDNNISELPQELFDLKLLSHLDIRGVALKQSIYKEYKLLFEGRDFFSTEPCDCQEE